MTRRLDIRTLGIMLAALAVGVAWELYSLGSTNGVRDDSTIRALVWAVFAAPAALFVGWLIARRSELGLAAFCCFCLYFFTFFVAQRIESLVLTSEQSAAAGHVLHFNLMIATHAIVGVGLTIWRALAPAPVSTIAARPVAEGS